VKKTHLIAILFVVAVIGMVVLTTFSGNRVRCEVCMEFNGRRDCRTVQAATRDEALRNAMTTACTQIASGVIESSQCENTRPVSVVWK
jgi:hypothetical protein